MTADRASPGPRLGELLQVVVRRRRAAQDARAGDWHDAYGTAAGAKVLVVGAVAGGDRNAATRVRDLLRTLVEPDGSPAALLSRLDRALRDGEPGTLATAVLARVERADGGGHRLRWSNAGHLPPLLRAADGTVQVLADTHDLALGVDPATGRADRSTALPPGSTLLLYSAGLLGPRESAAEGGTGRLARLLAEAGDRPPDEVADTLLAHATAEHEDDVTLIVIRAGNGQPR